MNNVFMRWACFALAGAALAFSQVSGNSASSSSGKASSERMLAASYLGGRSEKPESPSVPVEDSLFFPSPGNQLRLRWWGVGAGEDDLVVNTRWELVIPDRGIVSVRGRTFKQVRASVDSLLRSQVRIKMLDLQLVEIGKAQVQVTGLVPNPGVFEVAAGERLSNVLSIAGVTVSSLLRVIASNPPPRPGERYRLPSVRKIQLVRGSGKDTILCDLARAYNAGESEQDPRLYSGDQVRVLPQGPVVAVSGDAPFSGYVEYIPGETIEHFSKVLGLLAPPTSAMVLGQDGERRTVQASSVLDSFAVIVELPFLQHRKTKGLVWVAGFVNRPGGYVFQPGMTARQLLEKAGGSIAQNEDSSIFVGVKRGWIWLQAGRRPGMESSSQYAEVRQAMQGYQRQMVGNYSDPDAPLQVGDSVIVHQAEQVVWVGGLVNRPGFVPWKKGNTYNDYVDAAGGYADRAWTSRVQIFDVYTEQIVPLAQPIRPGAAVIVPEKRYLYFDQWISLSATVVSAVVSVMYFYLTVSKQ